ncbi:MAG TPA: nucleotidyltransferase domain-containing protein [Tepidisphaeraceae bacterium]|nr:nucleotidyltransferase domain-containing protein [Tepidisphaeraceae bacterium]
MIDLLESNRQKIESLCRRYEVERMEVFGSAARGDFDLRTSDVDFLITFKDLGWRGSFKRYIGLKLDLEELLGRPVDLVELQAATNPYFIETATKHRQLLYAA